MSALKKKSWVKLLPTDKAEGAIIKRHLGNILSYHKDAYLTQNYLQGTHRSSHHMYILSDDEIKEGDWYMFGNAIFQAGNDKTYSRGLKKVIASTDRSLNTCHCKFCDGVNNKIHQGIPSSSEGFINKYIESYNKGRIIEECMVTYDNHLPDTDGDYGKPQIRKDNTIIITEVKTEWTKEELLEIFNTVQYDMDMHIPQYRARLMKKLDIY